MASLEELMEKQPEYIQREIDWIMDKAGTCDAEWDILLESAKEIYRLKYIIEAHEKA